MNTRHNFDEKLEELSVELIKMADKATDAVKAAMVAFANGDRELARNVIEGDSEINAMERDIETRCLKLILQQQPVASDLRRISSAMKMITDIERIGDAAADISDISLHLPGNALADLKEDVVEMAHFACEMAQHSIDAYVGGNLELAVATMGDDDVVDDWFLRIRGALAKRMTQDPDCMDQIMDFLQIIKYLERVGDHAVNICEWVRFYLTGIHKSEGIS